MPKSRAATGSWVRRAVFYAGLVGWVALSIWIDVVGRTAPTHPTPGSGVAITYKGVIRYVQAWQEPLINWASPVYFAALLVLEIVLRDDERRA